MLCLIDASTLYKVVYIYKKRQRGVLLLLPTKPCNWRWQTKTRPSTHNQKKMSCQFIDSIKKTNCRHPSLHEVPISSKFLLYVFVQLWLQNLFPSPYTLIVSVNLFTLGKHKFDSKFPFTFLEILQYYDHGFIWPW